jgi:nucleoside-diphosphate-sugar epimerase
MVNVLVIGATGYIGEALCHSLLSSGDHRVYGLARTPEKANQLASQEVIPILGSITNNAAFLTAIDTFHINIVVDVSGANHESHTLLASLIAIGQARLNAAAAADIRIPKLGFIYTSGTWVHGSSNDPVNDLTPVGVPAAPNQPAEITSWRPALEQEIIAASSVLDTMVIRPALVYGRSSRIWSSLFDPLYTASNSSTPPPSVSIAAEPGSRPGLIHVDDVASGLHAAVDKLPLISGTGVYPIFDLVTSQESMRDILEAVGRKLGFEGEVKLVGTGEDLFDKARSTSFNGDSGRARRILGWEPKRRGFVGGMGVFVKAWVAGLQGEGGNL